MAWWTSNPSPLLQASHSNRVLSPATVLRMGVWPNRWHWHIKRCLLGEEGWERFLLLKKGVTYRDGLFSSGHSGVWLWHLGLPANLKSRQGSLRAQPSHQGQESNKMERTRALNDIAVTDKTDSGAHPSTGLLGVKIIYCLRICTNVNQDFLFLNSYQAWSLFYRSGNGTVKITGLTDGRVRPQCQVFLQDLFLLSMNFPLWCQLKIPDHGKARDMILIYRAVKVRYTSINCALGRKGPRY